jgi:hypothetical protein
MINQPLVYDIDESEFVPSFRPYLEAPEAVQLFIGNAGSGKSVFLYKKAVAFCLAKKYFRLLFGRKVKDTIRDSIFLGILDVIREWKIEHEFHIQAGQMDLIHKRTGNMMLSFGMDDPEKLKSIKDPSHILYDEFSDSTQADFAELRRRLRTNKVKKTQFWGAMNPVAGWWGRDYFFADPESDVIPLGRVESSRSDTLIMKATYHDNPFVNPYEIQEKNRELAILDENNWIIYEEGNWGKVMTGGEFYHQFKKRIHSGSVEYIPGLPVHISFDFNVLPYMTLIASQVTREAVIRKEKPAVLFTVRMIKEYTLKDPLNTTEACIGAFVDDFGQFNPDVFFYGDAMGNKRHEGTGNKTEFKKVKEMLWKYTDPASDRTFRSNPSVLQGRNFMNKILAEVEIVPGVYIQLIIDNAMKETIKDFESVKLGADGMLKQRFKDPKTGQTWELFGHTSDAVKYLILKMFEDYFKLKTT